MSRDDPFDPSTLIMRATAANAPLLERLATYGPSASLIGATTEWEAEWRRLIDRQQGAWSRPFGIATRRERDRTREHLAAQQAGVNVDRRVEISWHEGGEGPALLLLNDWTASGLMAESMDPAARTASPCHPSGQPRKRVVAYCASTVHHRTHGR